MGLYKHTLIFEAPGHGVSESLYYELPSPSTVEQFAAYVNDVKNKRAPLLGADWQIKGERFEQYRNDAGERVQRIGFPNRFYLPGVAAQPSAPENVSLQVLFLDYQRRFKKLSFLCGPPKSLFSSANALDLNQTTQPGTWLSSFNSWKSLLISLKAGWLSSPTTQQSDILGYSVNPTTGITTFTLNQAITWPNTGKPVRVSVEFPLSKSPLDGVQLVIPTGATTCYTASPRPAGAWTVKGLLRLTGSNLITVGVAPSGTATGNIIPQVPMSRKRGRPLLVSRGRVQVRSRW